MQFFLFLLFSKPFKNNYARNASIQLKLKSTIFNQAILISRFLKAFIFSFFIQFFRLFIIVAKNYLYVA